MRPDRRHGKPYGRTGRDAARGNGPRTITFYYNILFNIILLYISPIIDPAVRRVLARAVWTAQLIEYYNIILSIIYCCTQYIMCVRGGRVCVCVCECGVYRYFTKHNGIIGGGGGPTIRPIWRTINGSVFFNNNNNDVLVNTSHTYI